MDKKITILAEEKLRGAMYIHPELAGILGIKKNRQIMISFGTATVEIQLILHTTITNDTIMIDPSLRL
ncbi:hypothetical protein [Bacillus suaedaesalsae]|uniref:Uncharacterized protein n=1 Tax=Bacillus suaedaesalsae TaxID=2810349 RepID=A0ABS2DI97_9BACI|nr:hypothetical protein [Bacillus suaedaesalsae]MBM6618217.1 hypothetical protein [Bacillus suaedaesalsae]